MGEDSSNGRHVRKKVKPLQRYIPREFREDQDWLDMFQLIGQMLRYDPNKRLTLKEALDQPFLKKLKTRGPSSRSNSSYFQIVHSWTRQYSNLEIFTMNTILRIIFPHFNRW